MLFLGLGENLSFLRMSWPLLSSLLSYGQSITKCLLFPQLKHVLGFFSTVLDSLELLLELPLEVLPLKFLLPQNLVAARAMCLCQASFTSLSSSRLERSSSLDSSS